MIIEKILDTWTIQNNSDELYLALEKIATNDVIIYNNVISSLKINKQLVKHCQFETIIYSEESDTAILLTRDGKVKSQMAEKYFDEHGILYTVINFMDLNKHYKRVDDLNPFWFARDGYVVRDAIEDSLNKNITSCKYYPAVKGKLLFKYRQSDNGDYCPFMRISFKGIIKLKDKYVLTTLSPNQFNLHEEDVMEILNEYDIDVTKINSDEFTL